MIPKQHTYKATLMDTVLMPLFAFKSPFNKVAAFIKETPTQIFSCQFRQIFQKTFL